MNTSDFFKNLTDESNKWSKNVGVAFSVVSCLTIPCLLYSIIWFERFGSDKKRTLLNRIVSLGCWSAIEYLLCIQTFETVRYVFGPMPETFCFLTRLD